MDKSQKIEEKILKLYKDKKYEQVIEEAKKHSFNKVFLYNIMASSFRHLNNYNEAIRLYHEVLSIEKNPMVYYNLGNLYETLEKYSSAIEAYEKSLSLGNTELQCFLELGYVYLKNHQPTEAITCLKKVLKSDKSNYKAYNSLAAAYAAVNNTALARKNYKKAIEVKPDYKEAYSNFGVHCMNINKKDEAYAYFKKALELDPTDINNHRNIGMVTKYTKDTPHLQEMLELEKSIESTNNDYKYLLDYAIAKAYEDIGDDDKYFYYLNKSNFSRLQQSGYSFNNEIITYYTIKKFHEKHLDIMPNIKIKPSDKKPIFVLGMPRSGTTLVEQILSSHSQVYGAGELHYLSQNAGKILNKEYNYVPYNYEDEIIDLRKKYHSSLKIHNIKEPIFIDKMPENFKFLEFIIHAFPEAKIINLNREPMAICWSMFKQFFADGLYYSNHQENLGKYYKMYESLMEYWKKYYADRIYDLNYEALTENQEEETRKLLEYCELPWEDTCLEFHKNKRVVATASHQQVRKGMYKGSSQKYKKYEKYLQPLITVLKKDYPQLKLEASNGIINDNIEQLKYLNALIAMTKTARNAYYKEFKAYLPKPQEEHTDEELVEIAGKRYLVKNIKEEIKAEVASYQTAAKRLRDLENRLNIFKTALAF